MLQRSTAALRSGIRMTAGLGLLACVSQAQPNFTMEQARAGREAYREQCATCHGPRMEGDHRSPSLAGPRFDQMWRGKGADILSFHVRRMPPPTVAEPGSVSDEAYTNILAYILMSNDFEPGDKPLPSTDQSLKSVTIPLLPGQKLDPLAPATPTSEQAARLDAVSAVSQAVRENPSDGDWLHWGRTYDGHSYSPLTQINEDTVNDLTLAWRQPIAPGPNMPAPQVHDGILYMHTFPDTLIAVDAATGGILWRYARGRTPDHRLGIAFHNENVIVATSDLHVVALNARNGDLIWQSEIVPENLDPNAESAIQEIPGYALYRLRSAPMVIGDRILQGVTASAAPGGGFITGIDATTGKEVWRLNTIARPGAPGGNSWNDVPMEKRSGGSVWHQGTYDPELNLAYFGVAPTYDTGPLLNPVDREGVTSDALYTNCTLAITPETGELVWHYQHLANDQWDLDWAFERQIVPVTVDGEERKALLTIGKIALLDAIDAATGEYLFSIDTGVQNFIVDIDPDTGAKTIDPDKLPNPDQPTVVCPNAVGSRSWPTTSYSPRTGMTYLALFESCMNMIPTTGRSLLTSGVTMAGAPHPEAADGFQARLQALDIPGRKLGWAHHQAMPLTSSVLSTAGGLVFVGDMEPSLQAFDDTTGKRLWHTPLDNVPSSNIITYEVDGTQYLAVVVGASNLHHPGLMGDFRRYGDKEAVAAHKPVRGGTSIWVFALNGGNSA